MHLIWWFVWVFFIFWMFISSYGTRFMHYKRNSPLDILKQRLVSGQITKEEYQEKKQIIEKS
jgi:putative membrane protein